MKEKNAHTHTRCWLAITVVDSASKKMNYRLKPTINVHIFSVELAVLFLCSVYQTRLAVLVFVYNTDSIRVVILSLECSSADFFKSFVYSIHIIFFNRMSSCEFERFSFIFIAGHISYEHIRKAILFTWAIEIDTFLWSSQSFCCC